MLRGLVWSFTVVKLLSQRGLSKLGILHRKAYEFPHDHHGLFRRRRSTRLSALGSKIPAYVLITGVYWLIYSTRGNVDCRDTISTELTRRNIIHLMHSLNDVNEHKKYPVFFCVLRISIKRSSFSTVQLYWAEIKIWIIFMPAEFHNWPPGDLL